MLQGVQMGEEIAVGSHFLDDIQRQGLIIHRDAPAKTAHLIDDFIQDHNHFQAAGQAEIQVTHIMI